MDHPSIGIDIDGTIDEIPIFFRILSRMWQGKVFIITYRSNREKAIHDLAEMDITYHELILVKSFEEKSKVIVEKGIAVYFDDQDEVIQHIPSTVAVVKVRNGGNFNFDSLKWMYSDRTGEQI